MAEPPTAAAAGTFASAVTPPAAPATPAVPIARPFPPLVPLPVLRDAAPRASEAATAGSPSPGAGWRVTVTRKIDVATPCLISSRS